MALAAPLLCAADGTPGPAKAGKEGSRGQSKGESDAPAYDTRTVEGWTVHVSRRLLEDQKDDTAKTLDLLAGQLANIVKVVPAPAVGELRKVRLWLSPEYPGVRPTAEYHPDAGWLRAERAQPGHGQRRPSSPTSAPSTGGGAAGCRWSCSTSWPTPTTTGCSASTSRTSSPATSVPRRAGPTTTSNASFGIPACPTRKERAYAMTNAREYFAESSEAYFGRNDFYPFTRDRAEAKHDPEMFELLERLWNRPEPSGKPKAAEKPGAGGGGEEVISRPRTSTRLRSAPLSSGEAPSRILFLALGWGEGAFPPPLSSDSGRLNGPPHEDHPHPRLPRRSAACTRAPTSGPAASR